ncbi:MAG: hypothetical protein QG656_1923, partial [Candidatus Hydrogenedentes bacterium]|nr:hypothetical protein [Candidatus Hydrogenedentota bacterium]
MRRRIGCVLSCVLLSALVTAEPETPALLHLRFSDETGQPVRLQSAQILVLFSGGYSTVSLPVEESELTIPLTFAWLKQLDERICGDGSMMHQVLYFKADGYVSVQSNAFAWPETEEWNHGEPGEHNIEFMPGMRIDLAPGKELTLNVPFRKPAKRHLRFVDEQGVPMSGVKFSYGPFGFGTGRCGNLWTIEDYGTCETGVEGRAEIQDADVEYLFIIEQNRFSLWNPEPNASGDPFVNGLHMRLSDEETTVVMHRWTCV